MVVPLSYVECVCFFFFWKFNSQFSCYLSLSLGASFSLVLLKFLEQSYQLCLILPLLHLLFCRTNKISSFNIPAEVTFCKLLSLLVLLQTQSHLSLSALKLCSQCWLEQMLQPVLPCHTYPEDGVKFVLHADNIPMLLRVFLSQMQFLDYFFAIMLSF